MSGHWAMNVLVHWRQELILYIQSMWWCQWLLTFNNAVLWMAGLFVYFSTEHRRWRQRKKWWSKCIFSVDGISRRVKAAFNGFVKLWDWERRSVPSQWCYCFSARKEYGFQSWTPKYYWESNRKMCHWCTLLYSASLQDTTGTFPSTVLFIPFVQGVQWPKSSQACGTTYEKWPAETSFCSSLFDSPIANDGNVTMERFLWCTESIGGNFQEVQWVSWEVKHNGSGALLNNSHS